MSLSTLEIKVYYSSHRNRQCVLNSTKISFSCSLKYYYGTLVIRSRLKSTYCVHIFPSLKSIPAKFFFYRWSQYWTNHNDFYIQLSIHYINELIWIERSIVEKKPCLRISFVWNYKIYFPSNAQRMISSCIDISSCRDISSSKDISFWYYESHCDNYFLFPFQSSLMIRQDCFSLAYEAKFRVNLIMSGCGANL